MPLKTHKKKKKTKVHVKSMKNKKTNSKNLLFQLTLC